MCSIFSQRKKVAAKESAPMNKIEKTMRIERKNCFKLKATVTVSHRWLTVQLVLVLLLVISTVFVNCDKTILNEIDNGSQQHTKNTLTELTGGRVIGEKWLRQMESPYLLLMDLSVERSGKLFVEPGVTVHVAPMVGITVRGVLTALVSNSIYLGKKSLKVR